MRERLNVVEKIWSSAMDPVCTVRILLTDLKRIAFRFNDDHTSSDPESAESDR
jgi:hypothetical protein